MLIQRGSRARERVRLIQQALVAKGFLAANQVDGSFGPITEKAVIEFQIKEDLFADGKVGDATLVALGIKDEDTLVDWKLCHSSMVEGAKTLGVSLPFIQAIAEVESAGEGFHKNSIIKVLYERHIFRQRCLHYRLDLLTKLVEAEYPDLANQISGGYVGGLSENKRIERAKRIHPDIAQESASYGRFQIMGFHWERLGFANVSDFVEFNDVSEDNQFKCFLKFIQTDERLHNAARREDSATFATIYNGKNHKGYDVKIDTALARFKALAVK